MITWQFQIDWADRGDWSDPRSDISADVLEAEWRLGWRDADDFADSAPPGEATILLDNTAGIYDPDANSEAGHARTMRILTTYNAVTRVMFVGQIAHMALDFTDGKRRARWTARTIDAQFDQLPASMPTLIDVDVGDALRVLLERLSPRRYALTAVWGLDLPDSGRLNTTAVLAHAIPLPTIIESGITRFPLIAAFESASGDMPTAAEMIRAFARAEDGRAYIDRAGVLVLRNRHHRLRAPSAITPLTTGIDRADPRYFRPRTVYRVTFTPGHIAAALTALWTLNTAQRLSPGVSRFIVRYRDAAGNSCAALDVSAFNALAVYDLAGGQPAPITALITVTTQVGEE